MEFGVVSIDEAEGAILAHSFALTSGRVRKGCLLTRQDIQRFRDAGVASVTVARLGPGDVGEDDAARRLSNALTCTGIRLEQAIGGRINFIARDYGVFSFQRERLDDLNAIDESLTMATLTPFSSVEPGQMVGTVKVIPFGVPNDLLQRAEECARGLSICVAPSRAHDMGLIQTVLPGTATKVLDKSSAVTRHRIEALGSYLVRDERCAHHIADLAQAIESQVNAGVEMVLVIGASAIADRRDVIPAAIERCSGTIEHFGIPVDPGNLLLLGRLGDVAILGVPGCARSAKLNGLDWVLQRLVCGLPVSTNEIAAMGNGGLLKEIAGRPMPRSMPVPVPSENGYRVYILVLAAGDTPEFLQSSGGAANIADVVAAAIKSNARGVYVVTGAWEEDVAAALKDFAVSFAYNPSYDEGISSSLRRGLSALPVDADAVVVCRANDPPPPSTVINALITAFDPKSGRALCMPAHSARRGPPLLIGRQYFAELHELEGDAGAHYLVTSYPSDVAEVPTDGSDDPLETAAVARP